VSEGNAVQLRNESRAILNVQKFFTLATAVIDLEPIPKDCIIQPRVVSAASYLGTRENSPALKALNRCSGVDETPSETSAKAGRGKGWTRIAANFHELN
jgi:hypothetical protein